MYTIEYYHPDRHWLAHKTPDGDVREFPDYPSAQAWLAANPSPYTQRIRLDGVTVMSCAATLAAHSTRLATPIHVVNRRNPVRSACAARAVIARPRFCARAAAPGPKGVRPGP